MTNTGSAALEYRQRGLSVIPISPETKTPLVKWKPYQRRLADEATISKWFTTGPDANLAIVTGAISGLVVLDSDHLLGTVELARMCILDPTWSAISGRGCHFYFAHPGVRVPTRRLTLGLDVKGDGGYVIAPPSLHPTRVRYEWYDHPGDSSLALIPPHVLTRLLAAPGPRVREGLIPQGERNGTLYRMARSMVAKGSAADVIEDTLMAVNAERCRPPLSEAEVRAITAHALTQEHRDDFTPPDAAVAEVRAYAERLRSRLATWPFQARMEATYRRVIGAHLDLMARSGHFVYGASLRQIAELSGLSMGAVHRAHDQRCDGWVELEKGSATWTAEAALWRVHIPSAASRTPGQMVVHTLAGIARLGRNPMEHLPLSPLTASNAPRGSAVDAQPGIESAPRGSAVDVWCRSWQGKKGLGASAERLYEALSPSEPQSARDLALTLRISSRAVRQRLAVLEPNGLAVRSKAGWRRGDADLDTVAARLGVAGRSAAIRAEHRRQRDRFDEVLADGWRLGGTKPAKGA